MRRQCGGGWRCQGQQALRLLDHVRHGVASPRRLQCQQAVALCRSDVAAALEVLGNAGRIGHTLRQLAAQGTVHECGTLGRQTGGDDLCEQVVLEAVETAGFGVAVDDARLERRFKRRHGLPFAQRRGAADQLEAEVVAGEAGGFEQPPRRLVEHLEAAGDRSLHRRRDRQLAVVGGIGVERRRPLALGVDVDQTQLKEVTQRLYREERVAPRRSAKAKCKTLGPGDARQALHQREHAGLVESGDHDDADDVGGAADAVDGAGLAHRSSKRSGGFRAAFAGPCRHQQPRRVVLPLPPCPPLGAGIVNELPVVEEMALARREARLPGDTQGFVEAHPLCVASDRLRCRAQLRQQPGELGADPGRPARGRGLQGTEAGPKPAHQRRERHACIADAGLVQRAPGSARAQGAQQRALADTGDAFDDRQVRRREAALKLSEEVLATDRRAQLGQCDHQGGAA